MFLKEREQLFLLKTNQEQEKSASSLTSDNSPLLIIDENVSETLESENESRHSPESFSSNTTTTETKSLEEKSLPDPYILPSLPSQVNDAINLKKIDKFEKLCNFRSIVIDTVFHDLKTNYNLLYPTRSQYASIVHGILKHLGIEHDQKNANSWRESLISKYKRERQNINDDRIAHMKNKYSQIQSGRKIKGFTMTQMSERKPLQTINSGVNTDLEQMKAKSDIINKNFSNCSFDDQAFKRLWIETHEHRQNFIKQHTTADILQEYPVYSNPTMILADVKILACVDLDYCVKEKMDILSRKILSGNQFPTDSPAIRCLKVLCSILNDSWKHYICFYPEKPSTPQPTIVIQDDNINIYVDWELICSSHSIEQSFAVLVGLYRLLNLKFNPYRSAIRFLYVYFLNDKQQPSNIIRRFCKEYNIEIQENLPSLANQNEEAADSTNNTFSYDVPEDITADQEKENKNTSDQLSTPASNPQPITNQNSRKRKPARLTDPLTNDEQNTPPTKKTRLSNPKRR
ncbi:unnamed protein product [Rotaria sp. Silwood1]|nr:unnamed protein product [Rotaria sp. Silwood1]